MENFEQPNIPLPEKEKQEKESSSLSKTLRRAMAGAGIGIASLAPSQSSGQAPSPESFLPRDTVTQNMIDKTSLEIKQKLEVMEEVEAQRKWLEQNIGSEEYKNRLEKEGMNSSVQKIRKDRIEKSDFRVDFHDPKSYGQYRLHDETIHINPTSKGTRTGLHEYQHKVVDSGIGMSDYAADLYDKSFNSDYIWQGRDSISNEESEREDYLRNPTERDSRKKVLEYDMERLGIKKYAEPFTQEHYKKLMELRGKGILDFNSEEFLGTTLPEYMEQIMNTIAENNSNQKPDKNFYWDGQDLKG